MDYTNTLDKALFHLRELEMDKALVLFYRLLADHSKDLELIRRIYCIEVKHPQSAGFEKICRHIFSLQSSQQDIHDLIVTTYDDFYKLSNKDIQFSRQEMANLLRHLAQSHHQADAAKFAEHLKKHYSNDLETPDDLFLYCEVLISKKQMIKAREELKYLITYYGETTSAKNAIPLLSWVKSQIN